MKLYNRTKIDNKALERILQEAAKAVYHLRTRNVVIRVTTSQYGVGGFVRKLQSGMHYEGWLKKGKPKGYYDKENYWISNDKLVSTDDACMFLKIPVGSYLKYKTNLMDLATAFYGTVAHEWRHIADYQNGAKFGEYNRNWKNRPHERRAIRSKARAMKLLEENEDTQKAVETFRNELVQMKSQQMKEIRNED